MKKYADLFSVNRLHVDDHAYLIVLVNDSACLNLKIFELRFFSRKKTPHAPPFLVLLPDIANIFFASKLKKRKRNGRRYEEPN